MTALATDPTQERVDERPGALLAGLARHVDGVADDGRCRHAIQMQKLKDAAAQDVEDFWV